MKEQITIEELLALEPGSYLLYDMRDRYSFDYGAIPGAEHKEQAAILEAADSLPKDMPVIICCKSGLLSDAVAEELRTHGVQAMNLQGGYYGYLMQSLHFETDIRFVGMPKREATVVVIFSRTAGSSPPVHTTATPCTLGR